MTPSHKRGFTLIELLVVVAIIALLIAILLPSLGKARDQAKLTTCGARLKQWGVAMNLYAQTNANQIVNKLPDGTNWLSNGTTGNALYSGELGTPDGANKKLFFCNSNIATPAEVNYMVLWPIYGNNVRSTGSGGGIFRTTDFRRPAETLLMADASPNKGSRIASIDSELMVPSSSPPKDTQQSLKERHRGSGNILFMDSHVEPKTWKLYTDNIPSTLPVPAGEMHKKWTMVN